MKTQETEGRKTNHSFETFTKDLIILYQQRQVQSIDYKSFGCLYTDSQFIYMFVPGKIQIWFPARILRERGNR